MDEKEFKALENLFKKKQKLLDTTTLVHSEAYDKAVRALLMDEEGDVDYGKLKDAEIQHKFAEHMSAHYLEAAKKRLGVKESKGKLEDEMLLNAYLGITSATLKSHVASRRHNYTKHAHGEIAEGLVKQQEDTLTPVIYKGVSEKDVSDIVRYIGASGFVDTTKMRREDVIGLLDTYHRAGAVSERIVEGLIYHKKPAAKKAA